MRFRVLLLPLVCTTFLLSLGVSAPARSQAKDSASAPPAVANGDFKIGIVSRAEALRKYDKQVTEYAKLKEEMAKLQKPLDDMTDKIKADQKRWDEQHTTMSEDDRRALEDRIQAASRDFQAEAKKKQGILEDKEKRVLQGLYEDFDNAVKHVGDAENYHLILEGNPESPNRAVLYFSETINMTPKVIDYLNSHAAASTPKAPAPKAKSSDAGSAKKEKK